MKGVPRNKRLIDLTGRRFGRLSVLYEAPRRGRSRYWTCGCTCGALVQVYQGSLIRGLSKSCGCSKVKHGHARGGAITRTWQIWSGIKDRCLNPNGTGYELYGGRGVTICERWLQYSNFLNDMGEPPSPKHTIERINNSLGYFPENCRWATRSEQARNRSSNTLITFKDRTQTQIEWAEETGLSANMIRKRLKRSWSVEEALTTPATRLWAKPYSKN